MLSLPCQVLSVTVIVPQHAQLIPFYGCPLVPFLLFQTIYHSSRYQVSTESQNMESLKATQGSLSPTPGSTQQYPNPTLCLRVVSKRTVVLRAMPAALGSPLPWAARSMPTALWGTAFPSAPADTPLMALCHSLGPCQLPSSLSSSRSLCKALPLSKESTAPLN